ncbi:PREDICTED: forkhead-associated domain-containing protein 1, partial [Acanthisitta chloris]|uniref:forkhead-associated domain-containing protein 1 n=1 Tax=Acanthisitta chloris TaxID=57068 RepID=UPI0004F0FC79
MRAFLKSSERCFQLKPHTTTIGSSRGADIVLQAAGVAGRHAALKFSTSENSFILQDFNSLHGTFVNSCQIQNASVRVRHGDILRFGTAGTSFQLLVDGAAQDEKLLRLEKEMSHLSGLETAAKRKDMVIRLLQEEITAMAKTLAQAAARNEVELTQKLLTFNQELGAKTEEIKSLREQINDLQKGSSQVFSHSLCERDLEIGRLQRESEKLKKDHALAAGLVSSLQREVLQKEQKIQQLQQQIEELKKENQEKDNQLAVVSAKCSRIKEETKHELEEREIIACRNRIRELEQDLEGLQREIQKHCAEQQSGQKQLAEKAKAEQLREMGRRERLLRADIQRAGQQVIEKVRQISDENQQSCKREKCLQEELSSRIKKEKEVSANIEVFKNSLQKLQVSPEDKVAAGRQQHRVFWWPELVQTCLRSSCSSTNLREELGQLEAMCLDQSISTIKAAVVEVAHEQLERLQESQAELLQEHTKELEAKHEQDIEIKIQQIILEKDKENKEILESAVAEEKIKCKKSMEEEQKKIQELESHLRSIAEATARKTEEQEVTESKLREALYKLEESTVRQEVLQQQVLTQNEQVKAIQEENEFQRQKLQEEVAGYREQSKQHSLTIMALEERLQEATQQQKMLEEDKAALVEKMEGWKLQEELAMAQKMLLDKEVVIQRLTRELSETRARMSDLRGELSEEQKVKLEQNQCWLKHQEREVNQLREKLSQMSCLVEEKDRALKAAAEQLRQAQAHCQVLRDASQQTVEKPENTPRTPVEVGEASQRVQVEFMLSQMSENQLGYFFQELPSDLADLGAKCRGLRHEETIQRQKEGLAELRERVKMLEKRQCSAAMKKSLEPTVILTKDMPEKIIQQTGLEMEPTSMVGTKLKAGKVPGHVPIGLSLRIINRVAGSESAEATDLGEKMYLDVIGALGSLMEMKELSGLQPVQHLPWEEREEAGLQRQNALELLYKKIRNLQNRLERKEELLKEYEGCMEQLRQNQESLQRCQEKISSLEDEAHREAEEKALLREALERTQLELDQKRLQRAAKRHKPGAMKPPCSGKLKAKEHTADAVKTGSSWERHHRGL